MTPLKENPGQIQFEILLTYVDNIEAVEDGIIVHVHLGIEMVWDEPPIVAGSRIPMGL